MNDKLFTHYSPLRYPGGKRKLAAFIAKICVENDISGHYVEPYSGGASVALFLLMEGYVEKITINDKDRSIYAFWYSVLKRNDELCERILNTEVNVENWKIQKSIQCEKETANLLDLGFSTLFLNRTNRSGIINGGMIGGIEQNGDYLINCRFNKLEIIERIKRIGKYKSKIRLYNKDAIKLIEKIQIESLHDDVVFYFDPPYYNKASSLYLNHYEYSDHKLVSEKIQNIENHKWIVSYDNVSEIQGLYKDCVIKEYSFKHTAYQSRVGMEVLFFSDNIVLPEGLNWNPIGYKFNKKNGVKWIDYKEPFSESV